MGLNTILPFEAPGTGFKGFLPGSAGTAAGDSEAQTAEGGFLALLRKNAAPTGTSDGFDAGADGRIATAFGLSEATLVQNTARFGGAAAPELAGLASGTGPLGFAPQVGSGAGIAPSPFGAAPVAAGSTLLEGTAPGGAAPEFARFLTAALDGTAQAVPVTGAGAAVGAREVNSATEAALTKADPAAPGAANAVSANESDAKRVLDAAIATRPVPPPLDLHLEANRLTEARGTASFAAAAAAPDAGDETVAPPPRIGGAAETRIDAQTQGNTQIAPTGRPAGEHLQEAIGRTGPPAPLETGTDIEHRDAARPLSPDAPIRRIDGASVQVERIAPRSPNAAPQPLVASPVVAAAPVSVGLQSPRFDTTGHFDRLFAETAALDGEAGFNEIRGKSGFSAAATGAQAAGKTAPGQRALENAVSPAAQKFAAIVGASKSNTPAVGAGDVVPGALPHDAAAKTESGFATLSPQTNPESGAARSLSPAIVSAAAAIARNAAQGENRFSMRLDPPELGRVDVRLKIGDDGLARAHLIVERPETLDMFLRDQRALERSLEQAGVKTDGNSLQFSLKGDEGGSNPSFAQTDQENSDRQARDGEIAAQTAAVEDPAPGQTRRHEGALNITI